MFVQLFRYFPILMNSYQMLATFRQICHGLRYFENLFHLSLQIRSTLFLKRFSQMMSIWVYASQPYDMCLWDGVLVWGMPSGGRLETQPDPAAAGSGHLIPDMIVQIL